ncbi:TonB-dependent receptor [Pseudoduganella sp. FT93W]|uniref:TonB-dependent receptor n=1 Tax=Duganella fentianensis TaxID=2692177 RepID=A0A845HUZ1_9BURK|nr:TonB-dependent receptor [Duganella fentianensis]MYN45254.1 TonB-dependent receptor [Duganella fentianensis]
MAWPKLRALAAGLLPALALLPAQAQQTAQDPPSLEELLRQAPSEVTRDIEESTSSRFARSAAQAPSVTYVVTDVEIARQGLRNMADILRTMPGLYVADDGEFFYVGARGLGRPGDFNARLLFLVDGMRVNENIYDAGLLGPEFFVDVDLIDRVEYAPGPGSALYGNNAFFGVVNIITKGVDKLHGLQLRVNTDSQHRHEARVSVGHRAEQGWESWLALSAYQQDAIGMPFMVQPDLQQAFNQFSWERGQRALGMFKFGDWTLRSGVSQREHAIPEYKGPDSPVAVMQDRRISDNHFAVLEYQHQLGQDWQLYAAISAKHTDYRSLYPFIDPEQRWNEYSSRALGSWWNADLRLSTQRWRDHNLMAGFEYQYDRKQSITYGLSDGTLFDYFYGVNRRHGLFVQDAWTLSESQQLTLGLRYDEARAGGASTNPRLAWTWNGRPDATLKLMYGSAFRAANLYEYHVNAPMEAPIPTPERIRTLELAWEQRLTPQLQYRASLYGSRMRDLISINHELDVFENSGAIHNVGAELGLERRWAGGQQLQLGVSLQRTTDTAGASLDNSPHVMVKTSYSQPLAGERLRWSWQLQSESRTSSRGLQLPGYALLNTTLLWRPADFELALSAYNLTDVRYFARPLGLGVPLLQEGRTVRLSISRRFGL